MSQQQDENTPLLVTVRVARPRQRYSHHRVRILCNILILGMLCLGIIGLVVPFVFKASIHNYLPWSHSYPHSKWPQSEGLGYEELQSILLKTPCENAARSWSKYYTAGPHLAGKNLSQAIWTKDRWQEFGVADSSIVSYDVYVNYPLGHRLALYERKSSKSDANAEKEKEEWAVKFEAKLEEDVLEEDPTSGLVDRIPTFHGYSASGNVTAPYVYVNYGTIKDFEDLLRAKVDLKGKIALIKYGEIFRGLKVRRAQELGMVGAVIYSDPGDDGDVTVENGEKPYPEGRARQPSSVQRGSAEYLSVAPGDPTTPGYPSLPGVPREDPSNAIPHIPSIPISYLDAVPLLKALNGHGPNASDFNKYWQGGGLSHKGVEYNIGPSPDGLLLNLVNEQEYVTTPMWNVIGIINGSITDEVVILGNHRDAWIAGGAADPNSGSAALNEVVRSFGKALDAGWKPLRTIVFASWDGEEYGLIGSTEWVEEFLPWLSGSAVAYLNVDVGTAGSHFSASASPLLNKVIYNATSIVPSPNQTVKGQSVRDTWDGKITTMGSGSDFTAFQDFAGIPSLDLSFHPGRGDAIYHYHSNYDSFYWMDTYGDPGWHYHATMARIWAMVALTLVEQPIIGFNTTDYAHDFEGYVDSIEKQLNDEHIDNSDGIDELRLSLESLQLAVKKLQSGASDFDARAESLARKLGEDIPWWKWWKKVRLFIDVRKVNAGYKLFERAFLYPEGLDGRNWFKHTVFAPGLWTGYSGATLPGLVESIDAKDWENAKRWCKIIEAQLKLVSKSME